MAEQIDRLKTALADRYAVQRELGRGGMATVYLATDLRHHRQVAIKVLLPELAATIGPERFLREIEIAAQLTHPHILPLLDSGEAGGFLYYVMPYVEGESLRTRLARERELPIGEAVRILRDVVDALYEAHTHGVVHRDIKPDNVLIHGQHAVVTDFGVAKAVSEATGRQALTTAGVALGTPAYMAPEQAAADPQADHRADIYAVGVMAYEMLAGRPPFTGTTSQAILAAHAMQAPEPVTQHRQAVPPALAELIMRCLAKKPADRWQRADEILHQLEAIATPGTGTTPTMAAPVAAGRGARSWRTLTAIGVGAAAVAGLVYVVASGKVVLRQATSAPKTPTLAVLPFDNLGAAEDEYFADGMTEELTSRLARLSGLAVIARTSAMQYKHPNKPIQQIGQELGADYLIEGSVRWEKESPTVNMVRITPQLIRAKDGTHVWAEPYEEPYGTGIFKMQSEIAERVANALSVTLLAADRKAVQAVPTENLKAHDLYLRGRFVAQRFTERDLRDALALFQQALTVDSSLAPAWVGIANAWSDLADDFVAPREAYRDAQRALGQALALDPALPEAHAGLAQVLLFFSYDWDGAERESKQAIARNPSLADAYYILALALSFTGRADSALAAIRRARLLDPLSANHAAAEQRILLYAGRYDEALATFRASMTLDSAYGRAHAFAGETLLMQGQPRQALDEFRKAETVRDRSMGGTVRALAQLGRRDEARSVLEAMLAESKQRYVRPEFVASAYLALNDRDSTFMWLEKAYQVRSAGLAYLSVDPQWVPLHGDPRFAALLTRMRL